VTRAEGDKQSNILSAEGLAQARLRQAEAEAQRLRWCPACKSRHPAQYLSPRATSKA